MKKKQIIAIGGGGFSKFGAYTPLNFFIEKYFLAQTKKKSPKICFIPTASSDSPTYIVNFFKAFTQLNCKPSYLSLFDPPTADLESYLLEHDAIYVGGGNTKSMLAVWKEWHLEKYLKKAWDRGIVLGGISAGALCWFEEGVTDSIPGNLTAIKCLGFLKGSHCPHYDGEKKRRPAYQQLIQKGMLPGIAADDHVALHFIDRQLAHVVRANDTGQAYAVKLHQGKLQEKVIEAKSLHYK